ncbi:Hpt domain-containing protein [Candidatus Nitrospira bockiana]
MSRDEADGRIRVQVDHELLDLIPTFLQNRRNDIRSLREAVHRRDFETARRLGHSMKGCGGGYGFDEITLIGGEIEEAAKRTDSSAILGQVDALSRYLERVEVVAGRLPSP